MTLPRGISGPGLFVRRISAIDPAKLREAGIRWVCVALRTARGRMNRNLAWYHRALDEDLVVTAFDWLPDPETFDRGLKEAASFALDAGSVWFVLNAEKEFRGHPDAAAAYADRALEVAGDQALGLVSYSVPKSVRDFPWKAFAQRVDVGIPEVYDREGAFDVDYDNRALDGYRAAGFAHVAPACGIYQRDAVKKPWRWRTPEEVSRHLSIYEQPPAAWLAWPIGTQMPPEGTLRALAAGGGGWPR